jgi:hypothetical protein
VGKVNGRTTAGKDSAGRLWNEKRGAGNNFRFRPTDVSGNIISRTGILLSPQIPSIHLICWLGNKDFDDMIAFSRKLFPVASPESS